MTTKTTATIYSFPPIRSPSTITPNYVQEAMTAKATRHGYEANVVHAKLVYMRRANPTDKAEIVLGWGDHTSTIVPLTPEQLKAICRDAHSLYFTTQVVP